MASTEESQREGEEEKDAYELMLERSGCIKEHYALQDCFFDKGRDWRVCQEQMREFRECMTRNNKAEKSKK